MTDWKKQLKEFKNVKSFAKHRMKYIVSHKWKSSLGEFAYDDRTLTNEKEAKQYMTRLLRRQGMEEDEITSLLLSTIKYARVNRIGRIYKKNKNGYYDVSLTIKE